MPLHPGKLSIGNAEIFDSLKREEDKCLVGGDCAHTVGKAGVGKFWVRHRGAWWVRREDGDRVLQTISLGLALNLDPPYLCLLSTSDFTCEPVGPI
jgi:hypothetical protein